MYGEITDLAFPVLFHQRMELRRIQVRYHVGADVHELYLVQKIIHVHGTGNIDRNFAGIDNVCCAPVFVSGR